MTSLMNEYYQRVGHRLGDKYDLHIREHLCKVYTLLGATALAAAVGALLQIAQVFDLGLWAAIASVGLVLGLYFYPDDGKNLTARLSMVLIFGFCSGQNLGPILQLTIAISPLIVFMAFVLTGLIFASLSLSALLAEQGKYLFLGGLLGSILSTIALTGLLNVMFQSHSVQMAQLYIGIVVIAAFVLFNTQNTIEKFRAGNSDIVQQSLELFFDVMSMFRRLLLVMIPKQETRGNNERRKRR